jgi:hypothetical protein
MCIALLGGMDRLGKHYVEEAGRVGISLRFSPGMKSTSARR